MDNPANHARSLRTAANWGFALAATFLLASALWFTQYLSAGGVYLAKEAVWLDGREALAVPSAAAVGGFGCLAFAIHYRMRLRAIRSRRDTPAA